MTIKHFTTGSDRLALFDLDGVLCDDRARRELALSRRWDAYFRAIPDDGVWAEGRALYLAEQAKGTDLAYLTGRRYSHSAITERWLARHGFDTSVPLIMRRDFIDWQRLPEFKARVVSDLMADGTWAQVTLYDDDPAVCAAVQDCVPGAHAVHCTWHIKERDLIRVAQA